MPQLKTQPEAVQAWLSQAFGGAEVVTSYIDLRELWLFQVYDRNRSPFPTLVVSLEALEDWELHTITADLKQHRVVERLQRQPGMRLAYLHTRTVEPDPD